MQTVTLNRPKWIASITCTAAAIFAVLAGICQQLSAKWSREWDMEGPAIADTMGLGVIAGLFVLVIVVNIVVFLWSHSEKVAMTGWALAWLLVSLLGWAMLSYGAFVLRLLNPLSVSP